MPRPKLTQVQVEEVKAMYLNGQSAEKIAASHPVKITPAGIRWILRKNGVIRNKKRLPGADDIDMHSDGDGDGGGDSDGNGRVPVDLSQPQLQYAPPGYIPRRESRIVTNLADAQVVAFIPKEFRANSVLLQVAKAVCEAEWKWPVMSIGDWLDTYLFITMKQRGVILGSYTTVSTSKKGDTK